MRIGKEVRKAPERRVIRPQRNGRAAGVDARTVADRVLDKQIHRPSNKEHGRCKAAGPQNGLHLVEGSRSGGHWIFHVRTSVFLRISIMERNRNVVTTMQSTSTRATAAAPPEFPQSLYMDSMSVPSNAYFPARTNGKMNSFHISMERSRTTADIDGIMSGTTTRRSRVRKPAPMVRAASNSSGTMALSPERRISMEMGMSIHTFPSIEMPSARTSEPRQFTGT